MPFNVPCYRIECKYNYRNSCDNWQPGDGTECQSFVEDNSPDVHNTCCDRGCTMTATEYRQWNGLCGYQDE